MAQGVEQLLSKHETLNLKPSTAIKKEEKRKRACLKKKEQRAI
jgi:hypothetical protein